MQRIARKRTPAFPLLLLISTPFSGHAWAADAGNAWQEVRIQGASPFPRDNLAATRGIDPAVPSGYLFGGSVDHFKRGPTFFNALFAWKVTGSDEDPVVTFAELAKDSPARPSVRAFPAIGAVRNGSHAHVYVFGGSTHDRSMAVTTAQDKFWRYDASTDQWHDLSALGGPSPRSGAVMIVWEDDLFVFGGVAKAREGSVVPYATHDDLWRFDTQDLVWSRLSENTGPRNKRMAMGGSVGRDGDAKLLIYGGEPIDPSRPVFPIDQETWTWEIAKGGWTRRADGPARNMASIGANSGGALVFGGEKEGGVTRCGAPFDQNVKVADLANIPAPLKRTAGAWTAGYFYVFGGFNFVCESEEDPGQIWNEKVYRIEFRE